MSIRFYLTGILMFSVICYAGCTATPVTITPAASKSLGVRPEEVRKVIEQTDRKHLGGSGGYEQATSSAQSFRNTAGMYDKKPPKITLIEPAIKRGISVIRKEAVVIRGRASDESGLNRVLINGIKANLSGDDFFEAEILLKIGNNRLTVEATDIRNNTATEEFTIKREKGESKKKSKSSNSSKLSGWYARQYALVIGIDRYQHSGIPSLANAVNDAKSVAQMFEKKMNFEVIELYNEQAGKKAIISAISEIRDKAGENDSFVFFFAGHGQGVSLENKEQEGYIIPYDAELDLYRPDVMQYDDESVSLSRLRIYSKDIKAKHIAMILDSCFSGLVMKRSIVKLSAMSLDYYNDLLSRKAINILSAGDDQPVSDGTGHSPFTSALLNALDNASVDIEDRDGYATFNQLAVYVKEKVEKSTDRRQRPQFDNLSNDDGDFVFKVK